MMSFDTACQERLWVMLLTATNAVMAVETVDVGQTEVRMAEVLQPAVRRNAPAVILVQHLLHEVPANGSRTRQLVLAGTVLGIAVVDHILVIGSRWVSLRERLPEMWG